MRDPNQKLCFKAGTRIFSIGEDTCDVYVISKGKVELSVDKNGETIIVDTIGENAIFGEMSLLVDGARLVNATAIEDTEVYPVSPEKLKSMINESSPFIQALMRIMAKTVQKLTAPES